MRCPLIPAVYDVCPEIGFSARFRQFSSLSKNVRYWPKADAVFRSSINTTNNICSQRAMSQTLYDEATGIDCIDEVAFQRQHVAFELTCQQFRRDAAPDESARTVGDR